MFVIVIGLIIFNIILYNGIKSNMIEIEQLRDELDSKKENNSYIDYL